jgi:hypothetical protein
MKNIYTPERISYLATNEIFVFGSNLQGSHGGGAARTAYKYFGAVMGQGVGLQGQSYAIPTMQGGVETIKPYVDDFIAFASAHSELTFYITRIGCGIAGFKDEQIAPLFDAAYDLPNIVLPKTFATIISTGRRYADEMASMKFTMRKIRFFPEDIAKMGNMTHEEMMDFVKRLRQEHRYTVVSESESDN